MNWTNVKLILSREVRDQLRDRRTLFMIAVLPLVLYPLLGMSFFQVAQFMRERPTRVLIRGLPDLSQLPPLVEDGHFAANLFTDQDRVKLLKVEIAPRVPGATLDAGQDTDSAAIERAREDLSQGAPEVEVNFPPDFAQRLAEFRAHLDDQRKEAGEEATSRFKVPEPAIYYNSTKETSQITYLRTREVLMRWREAIGQQNLQASRLPTNAAKPFLVEGVDVAERSHARAAIWSKILPFVLLLWALTGAFYPAVDLCAGEKERGTLETLLSSPAERSEIVWGKLLTVMLFSIATASLNLASMGITGAFILHQLPDFGPPPLIAIVWLLVALVPVSALFSGLCLALAAFARSSKEGQYYLMPLVLVTMPLTILPMSPGVELNLGNCLIPVTGIVLLLRTLLEGNYAQALPYVPLVIIVTLACCLLAVRWAADQFNKEQVLFRESERLDMGLWLRHLLRDREDTPSVPAALFCGVLILMIRFFMSLTLPQPNGFQDFVTMVLVVQLVVVLTPALLMTIMLTRSPAQTLLLRLPSLSSVPMAFLLALALHPVAVLLSYVVGIIYPVSDELKTQLSGLFGADPSLGTLVLVIAVVPAICEELAFRGFILSGLRHLGHKWRAIVISSIFFGATHAIFQQSLISCILGGVLGFIAVQTGSILPGMIFHITHNALLIVVPARLGGWMEQVPALRMLVSGEPNHYLPTWPLVVVSALASVLLFYWLHRLPYRRSDEEELQEAISQQATPSVAT